VEFETLTTAGDGVGPEPRPRYALGLCGLLLAVAGLTLAIARPYIAEAMKPPPPPEPRQKLSQVLAEAGEKLVDRMLDKVRGRAAAAQAGPPPPAQARDRPWLLYLSIAATALGLVGSLSGTAGWIRREEPRLAVSAMTIGAIAVAWVYIVAALVIALVIFFLLLLGGALGGTV
jgi:hypothetical protein